MWDCGLRTVPLPEPALMMSCGELGRPPFSEPLEALERTSSWCISATFLEVENTPLVLVSRGPTTAGLG